jgi:hypothetical protein
MRSLDLISTGQSQYPMIKLEVRMTLKQLLSSELCDSVVWSGGYERFGRIHCLHLQGKMQAKSARNSMAIYGRKITISSEPTEIRRNKLNNFLFWRWRYQVPPKHWQWCIRLWRHIPEEHDIWQFSISPFLFFRLSSVFSIVQPS